MFRDHLSKPASALGAELERARMLRQLTHRKLAGMARVGRVTLANLERSQGSVAALVTVLAVLDHRFRDQPPGTELGPWLAQYRKQAGLTQDRLRVLAQVSGPALVKVEHGRGHVSTLLAVMTALDLSPKLWPIEQAAVAPNPTAQIMAGDCRNYMRAMSEHGMLVDAIVTDPPYHLSTISKRFGRRGAASLIDGEPGSANPYRSIATGFMGQQWDGGGLAFDSGTWRAAYDVIKPGGYLVAFGGTRTFHRLAVAIEDAGFQVRDTIMWLYGQGFPKSRNLKGEHQGKGTGLKPAYEPILIARKPLFEANLEANVLRFGTGSLNIDACRVPTHETIEQGRRGRSVSVSIALKGALPPTPLQSRVEAHGRWPANVVHNGEIAESWGRYFYAAKASKADRGPGNSHPTVKPNDLMRYLVRMVTPAGGTVLDPFMGSGSTGVAALQEGFSFVGCEMVDGYVEIARGRLEKIAPGLVEVSYEPGDAVTRSSDAV